MILRSLHLQNLYLKRMYVNQNAAHSLPHPPLPLAQLLLPAPTLHRVTSLPQVHGSILLILCTIPNLPQLSPLFPPTTSFPTIRPCMYAQLRLGRRHTSQLKRASEVDPGARLRSPLAKERSSLLLEPPQRWASRLRNQVTGAVV